MRGVTMLVGFALTVGLFAASPAAADLSVDEPTSLDEEIHTTKDTLDALLPAPVQQASDSAMAAALPGGDAPLQPDPALLDAPIETPDVSTPTRTVDLETDPSSSASSTGEIDQAEGTIAPAPAPSLSTSGELPDYVAEAIAEDEGTDEQTSTHGQDHRSADTSSSVSETWDEMETEEKAAAAGALGLLLLGPLTLYSRIQRDDALENDTRREVYEIVEDNPGVCIQEVADQADVSYSTASYHLKRLVKMDYVTRREEGNKVLYYKNGGTFTADEQELIPILQNEEAMRVFRHIVENPWCYRAQVAEALDVSHTTVNWHLDRLQDADLVEEHREGRSCHLNVDEEALDRVASTMDKLEAAGGVETESLARPTAAAA